MVEGIYKDLKNMKEVLVLGGGGFIGRNIVQFLIDRGDCNITVADIKSGSNFESIKDDPDKADRFEVIIDDFSDRKSFNHLNKKFEEIYMLAAVVGVNRTLKNPHDVIRINTMLTMNTLDWVSRNPVKRILFSSSSENYAGTSDLFDAKIPTDESIPLSISDINHPRWTYAMTKMHGESAFIHSANELDFESVVVRYQNIIGPEMGFGHAIPHIVERFIKQDNGPIKIYGHDQTRAFCFIDDAVKGTIGAMENSNSKGEIYHIGNQEEISMEELTKYIGKLLNYDGVYENAITYPGSVSRRCPDISKAKADFNYLPKFKWKDSVQLTVEWYKEFFESGKAPPSGGFEPPEIFQSKRD